MAEIEEHCMLFSEFHDLLEPFMSFLVNNHTISLRYLRNPCLQSLAPLGDELALMVLLFHSKNELRPTEITIVGVAWWWNSADIWFTDHFAWIWTENLWHIHFVQQMHVLSGGRSRWQSLWWVVATSTQEAEPSPILYIVIKWPILYTWMEYLSSHYFGEWIADVLQPPETIHYFRCTAGMSLAEQGSATCRKYWSGQMEDRLVWGCSLEWGSCCGYWYSNRVAHQCWLCRNPLQLYPGFGT